MTTTNALRKLFKKLFNVDVEGNSATAVLDDALGKDISIGGGSREPLVLSHVNDGVFNHTFKEVYDAYLSGTPIFYDSTSEGTTQRHTLGEITYIEYSEGGFYGSVEFYGALLGADSWNDYLHFAE